MLDPERGHAYPLGMPTSPKIVLWVKDEPQPGSAHYVRVLHQLDKLNALFSAASRGITAEDAAPPPPPSSKNTSRLKVVR